MRLTSGRMVCTLFELAFSWRPRIVERDGEKFKARLPTTR